jgi:probable rRNA maturation factor
MEIILEKNITYNNWETRIPNIKYDLDQLVLTTLEYSNLLPLTKEIEIALHFCSDAEIREVNSSFRNQDKPTNVLSFPTESITNGVFDPQSIYDGYLMLGDIFIALETLEKESTQLAIDFADHFAHLLVHSILHLIGYDHELDEEAELMQKLEIDILAKFGIKCKYYD